MNRTVDEEGCLVQDLHFPVIKDVPFVIDTKKIALVDHVKVHAEGIDLDS